MKYRTLMESENISKYAVRLNKGDNVKKSLLELFEKESITFGEIHGIGALNNITLGRYENGSYIPVSIEGNWDILAFEGNISLLDGKAMSHIHTALGDMSKENFGQTIGGHFMDADIAIVGELFITSYKQQIERVLDKPSMMKLWNL